MTQLQLSMDFACCGCDQTVGITVQCTGSGLSAGPRTVAAVSVPCPGCSQINQVCFHPTGAVVAVRSVERPHGLPQPSVN